MRLISLEQYIINEDSDKNTHMTHIEDRVIYGGVDGARESILALRSLRDMLAGSSTSSIDVTVKWDGAPAVFCGPDPTDGRFFVAKKSIFNKEAVVYKTPEDIDADTSGDLNRKLKVALEELSKLGIKTIVQGDIMFTSGDIKTDVIEGVKYAIFQPNTIAYAVPLDSDMGKKISNAKLGVVFHTTYAGKTFASLKASYGVDISKFKKSNSVWYQDAQLKDLSGTATMTKDETAEVNLYLSDAGKIFQKISGTVLREIQEDPELARNLETFANTLVRKGEIINNPKTHVEKLISWMQAKFDKDSSEKRSDKGKATAEANRTKRMAFFSRQNLPNLELIIELQNTLVLAKRLIIAKLDSLKKINTFIRTDSGYKVTGQEGFVAIDKIKGGAVKLVDRLEFSKNNFSPDIIKGWQR